MAQIAALNQNKRYYTGAVSLKNKRTGEAVENSKSLAVMEAIYASCPEVENWSNEQREALFESVGVGKTVRGYNSKMVSRKPEKMRKKAE